MFAQRFTGNHSGRCYSAQHWRCIARQGSAIACGGGDTGESGTDRGSRGGPEGRGGAGSSGRGDYPARSYQGEEGRAGSARSGWREESAGRREETCWSGKEGGATGKEIT